MVKICCIVCNKYRNFENPKISHIFFKKTLSFSIICNKCGNEYEKYLKKKNQLKYQQFLVLLLI